MAIAYSSEVNFLRAVVADPEQVADTGAEDVHGGVVDARDAVAGGGSVAAVFAHAAARANEASADPAALARPVVITDTLPACVLMRMRDTRETI